MRHRALIHSGILHTAILVLVIFGLPHFGRDEVMVLAPIAVEIVTPSDISAAPKKQQTPQPKKPEPPKPAPEPPPPEPAEPEPPPPPEPAPPLPDQLPPPEVKEPPKPDPVVQPPQPPKPPKVKPKPPKPPKPQAKTPDKSFDSLLDQLADAPDDKPAQEGVADAPDETPQEAPVVSASEMDAVRQQIMGCWLEPTGLREGEQLVVEIRVVMNQDRTVREAKVVDSPRMRTDPFYRTLGESAVRALYNPRCNPLLLPPEKYTTWRTITFRFSPEGIY